MLLVDDITLVQAKRYFSDEFRQQIRQASQEHGVSEEAIMRDRLSANVGGTPVRYCLRPSQRITLAVDNTQ